MKTSSFYVDVNILRIQVIIAKPSEVISAERVPLSARLFFCKRVSPTRFIGNSVLPLLGSFAKI